MRFYHKILDYIFTNYIRWKRLVRRSLLNGYLALLYNQNQTVFESFCLLFFKSSKNENFTLTKETIGETYQYVLNERTRRLDHLNQI